MDKILEALSKIMSEEDLKALTPAIKEMVEESRKEVEEEAEKNLEEAYAELVAEKKTIEETAYEGYEQAYSIINDLRNRLEVQRAEFDEALDEGYEQAYQALLAEKGKNESLEVSLHEEYEKKFEELNSFYVEKINTFLLTKGKEIYEQARRDIMNDPSMVEHKIVLEKIVETVGDYVSDEDKMFATSVKLDAIQKSLEEASGRIKILESRNIRLSQENSKLNEQVKEAAKVITEAQAHLDVSEKKERTEKAKNASGRGKTVTENTEVIREFADNSNKGNKVDNDTTLLEQINPDVLRDMQVLAGTRSND